MDNEPKNNDLAENSETLSVVSGGDQEQRLTDPVVDTAAKMIEAMLDKIAEQAATIAKLQARLPDEPEDVPLPTYMTERETAAIVGCSNNVLAQWRSHGVGPPFVKFGSKIRYERPGVVAWMIEQDGRPVERG